jgi:hypothetical protein
MSELKTKKNDGSVLEFISSVENNQRRTDALALLDIFEAATGMTPKLWGTSIVGYGQYHYKSERSTQEGDWPLVAFSPRKASLTIYAMPECERYGEYLAKLGKHKTSVACIYINKLSDVDTKVLSNIIKASVVEMRRLYPDAQST